MRDRFGVERKAVEDVENRSQGRLGQSALVRPLGSTEHAAEGLEVGLFDLVEDFLQAGADVFRKSLDVLPETALGDDEAVVLGQSSELFVAVEAFKRPGVLPAPCIRDPLEEEQGEDVGLEIGGI